MLPAQQSTPGCQSLCGLQAHLAVLLGTPQPPTPPRSGQAPNHPLLHVPSCVARTQLLAVWFEAGTARTICPQWPTSNHMGSCARCCAWHPVRVSAQVCSGMSAKGTSLSQCRGDCGPLRRLASQPRASSREPRMGTRGLKVWAGAVAVWRWEGEPRGPPVTPPALGTGEQSHRRDSLLHTCGCDELSLITGFLAPHVCDYRHPFLLVGVPVSTEALAGLSHPEDTATRLHLCSGRCKHPKVCTQAMHGKAQGHSRGVQVTDGAASGTCATPWGSQGKPRWLIRCHLEMKLHEDKGNSSVIELAA